MRFPTHWVAGSYEAPGRAGKLITRHACGWSSISDDDARRVARERAKRSVDYAIEGATQSRDEYGYGVDPAREELIDTLEVESHPQARRRRHAESVRGAGSQYRSATLRRHRPTPTHRRLYLAAISQSPAVRSGDDGIAPKLAGIAPGPVAWRLSDGRRVPRDVS